ncbi:PRC-barrel domain-containing protein [Microvirga splendida]|uniref:PRC-barrel domain-containing protein n=1 Tax=Microvirga splendida TaxID=2795727 RepID=A0ABS0Y3X5_9HYPH|nr:PRC-barrel domain-containing protein [Microvirga splendida]MBJ6126998.1 PRC-barrel domain-containing protein [Microvirga splendida]
MIRLYVIAGVLLTTAAAAQGQAPEVVVDTPPKVGVWRASDLIGRNVFGPEGEDVGEISDVIIDQSGRIRGYVLSVGGTFGIGDRKVAVSPYALRIDPIDTTVTTGTVSGGISPSTPDGALVREEMRLSNILTPDRIIVNVPKGLLELAPQFEQP